MSASSSLSMSGAAAAPVSDFTLNPLSYQGLWLAVMTIPAFALLRIVAYENDCVGAAAVARKTRTPCAAHDLRRGVREVLRGETAVVADDDAAL